MIGLIDSTLREGEQMLGVYFTLEQKLEIVRHLATIGVEEIELGIAAMSADLPELLLLARARAPHTRFALWCRGLVEDVRASAALSPDVLSISLPVSDLHIVSRLGKDRSWLLRQVAAVTSEARAGGTSFISLGLEDATRANEDFLASVLRQAQRCGVDRIRLADTVGIATPMKMIRLVKVARKVVSMQLGIHTHNDFGMATANALAALDAGADWADVTILGIGERAGNARLEEVVGHLALNMQLRQYDTRCISNACTAVAAMAGINIYPHHPIIGKNLFACETGIHLDGLAKYPRTYEPFSPANTQAIRKVSLGKKIGCNAVYTHLHTLGLKITREDATQVTPQIRVAAQQLGRPLTDEEVITLVQRS